MSYAELLPQLIEMKLVEKHTLNIDPEKLPHNFDTNAQCDFHFGGRGHIIENYFSSKHKVQDLLDTQNINFGLVPSPSTIQQPLPSHGGATVSSILEVEEMDLVMDVD